MFLADFHVHSRFSDGKLEIPELVDCFGSRGFGCIAITDHLCETESVIGKASYLLQYSLTEASFPEYLRVLEAEAARAWDQYKMVILPGVELSQNYLSNRRSAHVLGLGISKFVGASGSATELARSIRAQGALAIAAHPVWTRRIEKQTYHLWDQRDLLSAEFDAWEVASGPYLFEEVASTRLPKIATSDFHVRRHMESWKTVLHCERHPEAILRAIRKQQLGFQFYNDLHPQALLAPA